jgi:patatin-like phospholipase/acyl hydrolase
MKILALDGGGVFGDVQAAVLEGFDAYEKFDCFVGTSIGSALAAATAVGLRKDVGRPFFHHFMPKIFEVDLLRKFNPFNSRYSDKELNKALRGVFRGKYYRDVQKPLFITAANVGTRTLKVFNSDDDGGWLLWEAVRAATAAETYFPSWKGLADGGVFANNPSMVAVAAASKALKVPLEEIEILSIGTGSKPYNSRRGPQTMFGWGMWLVDALLEGASDEMHDYFVRSLPLKKYTRIQFAGRPGWKMDSPKAMLEAEDVWQRDIMAAIQTAKDF